MGDPIWHWTEPIESDRRTIAQWRAVPLGRRVLFLGSTAQGPRRSILEHRVEGSRIQLGVVPPLDRVLQRRSDSTHAAAHARTMMMTTNGRCNILCLASTDGLLNGRSRLPGEALDGKRLCGANAEKGQRPSHTLASDGLWLSCNWRSLARRRRPSYRHPEARHSPAEDARSSQIQINCKCAFKPSTSEPSQETT